MMHDKKQMLMDHNKEKKHIRHPFTKIEDIMLARLVKEYGCSNWKLIASKIPGRNSRQCRDRWCFFLAPDLNKGSFSFEELRSHLEH